MTRPQTYWDKSLFSQPTGVDYEGFGNTDRSFFRRPSVWNVDLSLFKSFQVGKVRPEIRVDVANVFNHPNWGTPVTTFTANNFLQFTPSSRAPRTGHQYQRPRRAARAARPAAGVLGVS